MKKGWKLTSREDPRLHFKNVGSHSSYCNFLGNSLLQLQSFQYFCSLVFVLNDVDTYNTQHSDFITITPPPSLCLQNCSLCVFSLRSKHMTINENDLSPLWTVLTVNFENAKTLFLLTHTRLVALFSLITVNFLLKSNNNILFGLEKTRRQNWLQDFAFNFWQQKSPLYVSIDLIFLRDQVFYFSSEWGCQKCGFLSQNTEYVN